MIENPQLLAAFYNEVAQEIRRLRDERWRLSYYFIAEGTGVIFLLSDGKVFKFINVYVLGLLFVIQCACIGFYLYHAHLNHGYLVDARNTRRRLERLFGIHVLESDGEPIIPKAWKPSEVRKEFELRSTFYPLALFVAGVQFASMYVIVRLALAEP